MMNFETNYVSKSVNRGGQLLPKESLNTEEFSIQNTILFRVF